MNKDTLIDNKITYIDELIAKAKKKKWIKSALCNMAKLFALGFTVSIVFSSPLTALAAVLSGFMFHLLGISSNEKAENLIENLEKAKKHLESIRTKDLNGSNELNSKRKKKVVELKKSKSIINKQKKKMGFASVLCGITTTIGTIITLSTPLGGIFAGVGLLGLATTLDSTIKKSKKENVLTTRIENLQNDLDIINISKTKSNKKRKSVNTKPSQANKNTKAKVENRSFIPRQVFDDSNNKNEAIIDDYIYGLENQKDEEQSKHKVK